MNGQEEVVGYFHSYLCIYQQKLKNNVKAIIKR